MPSPFPGMNPFLEQAGVWSTFHTQAMAAMSECLAPQVRPHHVLGCRLRLAAHLAVAAVGSLPDEGVFLDAQAVASLVYPRSIRIVSPLRTSHMRKVLSLDALSASIPSG